MRRPKVATRRTDQDASRQAERAGDKTQESPKKSARRTSDARDSTSDDIARTAKRKSELTARKAAGLAMQQVMELAGRDPEGVTSLERTEQGWRVGVEVVESHRVPDSADILAVYDTELNQNGELLSYRRSQRYSRGHQE